MVDCNIANRTIFCRDNLDILRGINSNCIDLIYLDPPFNKNKKFTAPVGSSAGGAEFKDIFRKEDIKEEWLRTIEEDYAEIYQYLIGIKGVGKPYNFAYLAYMVIRMMECHRVLKPTGSIYLHCDPTMSHYLKVAMDCIFKEDYFRNEIIWKYGKVSNANAKKFLREHDTILFYSKSRNFQFNPQFDSVLSDRKKQLIDIGYNTKNMDGQRYLYIYDDAKVKRRESLGKLDRKDFDIVKEVDTTVGNRITDVFEIDILNSQSSENTKYPTQKPLKLLQRIIQASSNEGDIVLDPFCGCATTCVAAERLNRQWIGIDISIKAFELVKERLTKEAADPYDLIKYQNVISLQTTPPPEQIWALIIKKQNMYT